MTWVVYTEQVNQDMYEVEADSEMEARKKAKELWKEDYGYPIISVCMVSRR